MMNKTKAVCALMMAGIMLSQPAVNADGSTGDTVSSNELHDVLPVTTVDTVSQGEFHDILPASPVQNGAEITVTPITSVTPTPSITPTLSATPTPEVLEDDRVQENDAAEVESTPDETVEEESVSDNTIEEKSTDIIRVVLPIKLNFAIDPNGVSGMGQILSSDYDMINYSNVPIEIEITDIYYEFADPENCISLSEPYDSESEDAGGKKAFYLYMGHADLEKQSDGELKRYYNEYIDGQDQEWGIRQ